MKTQVEVDSSVLEYAMRRLKIDSPETLFNRAVEALAAAELPEEFGEGCGSMPDIWEKNPDWDREFNGE